MTITDQERAQDVRKIKNNKRSLTWEGWYLKGNGVEVDLSQATPRGALVVSGFDLCVMHRALAGAPGGGVQGVAPQEQACF
jgi:hypothetical protein